MLEASAASGRFVPMPKNAEGKRTDSSCWSEHSAWLETRHFGAYAEFSTGLTRSWNRSATGAW